MLMFLMLVYVAIVMGVDAFFRVKAQVLGRSNGAGAAAVDGKMKRV